MQMWLSLRLRGRPVGSRDCVGSVACADGSVLFSFTDVGVMSKDLAKCGRAVEYDEIRSYAHDGSYQ